MWGEGELIVFVGFVRGGVLVLWVCCIVLTTSFYDFLRGETISCSRFNPTNEIDRDRSTGVGVEIRGVC